MRVYAVLDYFAYLRVSTPGQAIEGISLDAQRASIEAWCAMKGVKLDPAHVFQDAGLSGKRADNRPGLQTALDAVCATPGNVLVVYSLSRLARSLRDSLAISERLKKAGCHLVSTSESIDTTSATGKMVFHILSVLAEFERELTAERTLNTVAYKRTRGERIGQLPYGQVVADDGRTLLPSDREERILAEIRHLRSEGWSLRDIAAELTRRGEPTKNGRDRWSHSTVADILTRGNHGPKGQEAKAS